MMNPDPSDLESNCSGISSSNCLNHSSKGPRGPPGKLNCGICGRLMVVVVLMFTTDGPLVSTNWAKSGSAAGAACAPSANTNNATAKPGNRREFIIRLLFSMDCVGLIAG